MECEVVNEFVRLIWDPVAIFILNEFSGSRRRGGVGGCRLMTATLPDSQEKLYSVKIDITFVSPTLS
jgi:hypothetical protein